MTIHSTGESEKCFCNISEMVIDRVVSFGLKIGVFDTFLAEHTVTRLLKHLFKLIDVTTKKA